MTVVDYSYRVSGIHCPACEQRVRRWFADDARIDALIIDLAQQRVTFAARSSGLEAHFRAELHAAGYGADP